MSNQTTRDIAIKIVRTLLAHDIDSSNTRFGVLTGFERRALELLIKGASS